ncbi:MAG: hypothetical protein WC357_02900 [Candidatus Omnitrophota bacterium]|jgi:hypothetical protein
MENNILRKLILETLKEKEGSQYLAVVDEVEKLAAQKNILPEQNKHLNSVDKIKILEIMWDLIVERILTVGLNECNPGWPFVRLSEYGESVAKEGVLPYYDPEEYASVINSIAPAVDQVIKQYAIEGINCFRQRLFFASAVMFGAAAEKTILTLLESIAKAETDHKVKAKMEKLLERPNLPEIFASIRDRLDSLIKAKTIPYSVHEGSIEHLLSLFEMIRVQRNDAVHPDIGEVNKTKIFLVIQTFPGALEVTYRLIKWLNERGS